MQMGIIGLGRMGANMARRLRRGGVALAAHNRNMDVARKLATETGLKAIDTPEALVVALKPPRVVWLMLPAGEVTEQYVERVRELLAPGDVLVDGANGNYREAVRRAATLTPKQIHFVDAGVSGGVWGLENGYALMLGGDAAAMPVLRPFIEVLAPAPDRGWLHCGPAGSGHFVKMIHNGIEYGMMQAMAEGFALMQAKHEFNLDLAAIAETWRHGSVVRSWLLDLTADFLKTDQRLAAIAPMVADSGEGRWTVEEAVALGVPAPVIAASLWQRFESQDRGDFAAKVLAMMRKGFGGHATQAKGS